MPNVKGATRKTTAQLALSGALEAKPGRYGHRKYEPKPTKKLGAAPKYFSPEQAAIWKEVSRQVPPDVLFGSDRVLLEMVCQLIAKLRSGSIKAMEQHLLLSSLQQLGMTPIARSRVSVPAKDKPSTDMAAILLPPRPPLPHDPHGKSTILH